MEAGHSNVEIGRSFRLEKIVEAHRVSEENCVQGQLVVVLDRWSTYDKFIYLLDKEALEIKWRDSPLENFNSLEHVKTGEALCQP